jgi:hypothetical protein
VFQTGSVENYSRAVGLLGMRNRIINGAMVIDQRNAGASVTITADGTYTLDRWRAGMTQASKFSVQQSTTAPTGFSNSLKVTSLSAYSVGSGDAFLIEQRVEGFNTSDLNWGTANAKTVTLSFQVYSSLTGTFGGSITNGAESYSYPFSYTISSANTWTTISITIAGPTAGTWIGSTNGIGMQIWFGLGVGSTYSGTAGSWASAAYYSATGATSVVGTNGATFYITGVQLEVGSSATGYEYENIAQTYSKCQRYYTVLLSGNDKSLCLATWYNTSEWDAMVFFPTMRSAPTLSSVTVSTGYYFDKLGGNITFDNISGVFGAGLNSAQPYKVALSGGVAGYCGSIRTLSASCFVALSAEL